MAFSTITNQTIELTGSLYCGNVSEIQHNIEYAMSVTNYLVLNLNPLVNMDISGAFMLYMVICNAKKQNKKIVLESIKNETVNSALRMAGILRVMKLDILT